MELEDQHSKSASKEKMSEAQEHEEKEKQKKIQEEKEKKRIQKRMKRDRKKQKKLEAQRELDTSREYSEDELYQKKTRSKVWANTAIPQHLKQKYVDLELDKVTLCIANVPANAQENEMREYFQTILITLKPALAVKPPVKKVEIGETKNFAVVTMVDRESRNIFLKMDSFEYQGYFLRVQKPKGFFDQIYDASKTIDPFNQITTGVEESDNQLYMGNIPTYLKDYELKKIVEAFGLVKFFKLMQQKNDNGDWVSKGYCFFEYMDSQVTERALEGLKNLELGKNKVRISKAQNDTANQIVEEQKPKEASNVIGGSYLATYPGIVNPTIQRMIDIPMCALTPSKVVQFMNMATPDDLLDDEYYEILYEDIMTECSKFGDVEQVEIPRPDLSTGKMGPNVGKVFVKFGLVIPAKKARANLNGRLYNKKTVIASFYNEDKYNKKDYLLKL